MLLKKRNRLPSPFKFGRRPDFITGQEVRLRRARDGRLRRRDGQIDSIDLETGIVTIRQGEKLIQVPVHLCSPGTRFPIKLPVDVLAKMGSFLSAKRSLRAACVSSTWHLALGIYEPEDNWRNRIFRRWPPPPSASITTSEQKWISIYRERILAEKELRKKALAHLKTRNFSMRLCAWPSCLKRLDSRRAALAHHAQHPGCWGNHDFSYDDLLFLKAQTNFLRTKYIRQLRTISNTASSFSSSDTHHLLAHAKLKYFRCRALAKAAAAHLRTSTSSVTKF
uniref:Uncharacterized protein n=1 Tax=Aureoumbra lagunensis TaxID=44058 RepID=A0A7S3K584_9STRA|mmetsp:Transcript_16634/g.24984  ORF Transcript_16634/g.24984 Transcript_16634/m.24984 type:complete len:280 (-) Transcript_16634:144-983(-)